ncbi:MAG: hypothetical protein IJ794_11315 [Lachnospiraceae bacterium]|nr:hypothetical protein [Lachnospiraceae bacterium]
MAEISEEYKKKAQDILDRERWQGYISGKVEGALNVLYVLDLDKEKRIEILSEAIGLCRQTAMDFLEAREIEYRIYKNENFTNDEKTALAELMSNETMKDESAMDHPKQTLAFISKLGGNRFIEECLPQVDKWIENGEEVSMYRIRNWLIDKYELF